MARRRACRGCPPHLAASRGVKHGAVGTKSSVTTRGIITDAGPLVTPQLPQARGAMSAAILDLFSGRRLAFRPIAPPDVLVDDDFQLALYLCYELHYRGFRGVDESLEWSPDVIGARAEMERAFELALRNSIDFSCAVTPDEVPSRLREIAERPSASLARSLARDASWDQFREFVIHRSAYHLKEADPHSWAIPRLSGPPKAALIQIQDDEYGGGNLPAMHSSLFADMMSSFDRDSAYGTYLDILPGATLATVNLMSMFGLHRQLRGAIVGHLAAFELGSAGPNRLYARGIRRLGLTHASATRFFDEHVVADSVHDMVATYDLAGSLACQEPELAADIVFGALALDVVDTTFSGHVLGAWASGRSSLLDGMAPRT